MKGEGGRLQAKGKGLRGSHLPTRSPSFQNCAGRGLFLGAQRVALRHGSPSWLTFPEDTKELGAPWGPMRSPGEQAPALPRAAALVWPMVPVPQPGGGTTFSGQLSVPQTGTQDTCVLA